MTNNLSEMLRTSLFSAKINVKCMYNTILELKAVIHKVFRQSLHCPLYSMLVATLCTWVLTFIFGNKTDNMKLINSAIQSHLAMLNW